MALIDRRCEEENGKKKIKEEKLTRIWGKAVEEEEEKIERKINRAEGEGRRRGEKQRRRKRRYEEIKIIRQIRTKKKEVRE